MNNSVILQVDESTKGLMEEIQSGITSSIEEGMRDVKDKVDSVDDNTDMILRKFKTFDGLSSTVDDLRSLANESKKLAEVVSPLQKSVSEMHEETISNEIKLEQVEGNISLLIKEVAHVGDKQAAISSETKTMIQNVLSLLSDNQASLKHILENMQEKQMQADLNSLDFYSRVGSSLGNLKESVCELEKNVTDGTKRIEDILVKICTAQDEFEKKYISNESVHADFEHKTTSQLKTMNESLEKLQATLDIVVNLVTPFWKKMIK